jgi:hypothetical protein
VEKTKRSVPPARVGIWGMFRAGKMKKENSGDKKEN